MPAKSNFRLGLVAHDDKKEALCYWAEKHQHVLSKIELYATGTTGRKIQERCPALSVHCLKSGPLGGDQQLGSMICTDQLTGLIFFIDPLAPHPHDVDIKALLRLAVLYNIVHAYNEATANVLIKHIEQTLLYNP